MVILGNCYYLYSDEAGCPDLDDRDECFCFGTMAIYRYPIESIVSNKFRIAKGKKSSLGNHKKIAYILNKHQIVINIVSLDLTKSEVRQRISKAYQNKINDSPLSEFEKPSIRNYTWMTLYLDSMVDCIVRVIKQKQRVGTIIPYYNEIKVKDREKKILENMTGDKMLEKFKQAKKNTELTAKRKVPDDMLIYPISAKAVDKRNLGIRIIDNVVSGFRRSFIEGEKEKFLGIFSMIQWTDVTNSFCRTIPL